MRLPTGDVGRCAGWCHKRLHRHSSNRGAKRMFITAREGGCWRRRVHLRHVLLPTASFLLLTSFLSSHWHHVLSRGVSSSTALSCSISSC